MVIGKMTREIISFISLLVYFVTANAMCVSDSDCKMQFPGHLMRCIGNTCEKEVGGSCQQNNECAIKNSVCEPKTNTCQCKPEYQNFDEERSSVCAKALATEECAADEDCFTNAKCTQNRCNCDAQQGYIPTKDSSRCLHKSSNATCSTAQNCPDWGDGTNCANGLCVCLPDYHFYEDKCYYTLKLKETCANDDKKRRCYLPDDGKDQQHVICNTNTQKCECERGYKPSDDEKKCSSAPAASLLSLGCLLMAFSFKMAL